MKGKRKIKVFLSSLWLLSLNLSVVYGDQSHEAMEEALEFDREPKIGEVLSTVFDTVTSPLKHLTADDPTTPHSMPGVHPEQLSEDAPKSVTKKVNVLSLSGGGMRARMSLVALKQLEEETGKKTIDLFDVLGELLLGG